MVTVVPETVQISGVVEAKLTGSPEEAVAEIVNGGEPAGTFPSAPKVIVCVPWRTVNPLITEGAAV
jgi:hypothetical protein